VIDVSMVGGPRISKAMRSDRSKAMRDDRCVYDQWAHMCHVASDHL
jgi:hypothetical protein